MQCLAHEQLSAPTSSGGRSPSNSSCHAEPVATIGLRKSSMMLPEAKKMKLTDASGLINHFASQRLQNLSIICNNGKIVIGDQGQIEQLLEVDYFNAAYMGHFKESAGQLTEKLSKELTQLCLDCIFGEKLALSCPNLEDVWATLDRWGVPVDAKEFFVHHPFVENANIMDDVELLKLYQKACKEIFGFEKRGGFTLMKTVGSLFHFSGEGERKKKKAALLRGALLNDLIRSNIVPVPIMSKIPSESQLGAFPDNFMKETEFQPSFVKKVNGAAPALLCVGCYFVGMFDQTITLFATIDILMKHMGKRYRESQNDDVCCSMDVDVVSGSTALMTKTIKWGGKEEEDGEEDSGEDEDDNGDSDDGGVGAGHFHVGDGKNAGGGPCNSGFLPHFSYQKREGYETLQLRHAALPILQLLESKMRQLFLKNGQGWIRMSRPDAHSLGRFIRAHQLSCPPSGFISFDTGTCGFTVHCNVPNMLKIMADHLSDPKFIGQQGRLLVDFCCALASSGLEEKDSGLASSESSDDSDEKDQAHTTNS